MSELLDAVVDFGPVVFCILIALGLWVTVIIVGRRRKEHAALIAEETKKWAAEFRERFHSEKREP